MSAVWGLYRFRGRFSTDGGQTYSDPTPWVALFADPPGSTPATVSTLSSITFHAGAAGEVTLTFSEARPCVQYGDGTWGVQAPVTIVGTSPASAQIGVDLDGSPADRWIHGAVRSPSSGNLNGYDQRELSKHGALAYNHALNVDPGATGAPVALVAGDVLIKARSDVPVPNDDARQYIENYAILVAVAELPAYAQSFRPPMLAPAATRQDSWAVLDISRVPSLPAVAGQTSVATVLARLRAGPRQALVSTFEGGRLLASAAEANGSLTNNGYIVHIANLLVDAVLVACSDAPTAAEKREILGRVAQVGIDYAEAAKRFGFDPGGAINLGPKFPAVLAAVLLQDAALLALVDGAADLASGNPAVTKFAEDWHTFEIASADTTRTPTAAVGLRPLRIRYDAAHIGVAEMSADPISLPATRDAGLNADYREFHDASAFGAALACNLIAGARWTWNNELFFRYADRAAGWINGENHNTGFFFGWWRTAWQAWRTTSTHPLYVPPPEAPNPPALKVNGDHIEVFWASFEVLHGSALVRREVRFSIDNGATWSAARDAGLGVSYDLDVAAENTKTLVQYRLVTAIGPGPWSRSAPWQMPADGTFALGDPETQAMITTGLAAAYDSRPFFERGLIGHYDATDAATLTGSPLQWAPKTAGGPTLVATGAGVTASGGWVQTNGTDWMAATLAAPVTTGQATIVAITETPAPAGTVNNRPNIVALQGVNGSLDILGQELRWDSAPAQYYLTGNNRSSTTGVSRFTRRIPSTLARGIVVAAGVTTGAATGGVRSIDNDVTADPVTPFTAMNALTTIRVGSRTGTAGTGEFGDVTKVRKIAIYDREMTMTEIRAVLAALG